MLEELHRRLLGTLSRDLLVDLYDMGAAQAHKAWEMVRDHAGLDNKRAKELVGQARFRMMEKGFVEVCARHGGQLLPDGILPGTKIRAFQPFMRFGGDGPGVVLGLASMPMPRDIPPKNQSRVAGVSLNEFLTPRLDLGDVSIKPGDVFVLFLVARDRARPGMIDEVAIGIIDAGYKSYIVYEPIDGFLAAYDLRSDPDAPEGPAGLSAPLVRLKPRREAFKPPEAPADDGEEGESGA